MKAKNYTALFLNVALKKTLLSKKLSVQFKQYVCGSRGFGNLTLDYLAFISLFRKIILFVQSSVRARTPVVFFFENLSTSRLYKSLAVNCGEETCFTPKAYNWIYNWNPQNLITPAYATPALLQSGIALFSAPITYVMLLKKLLDSGWPVVAPVDLNSMDILPHNYNLKPAMYYVPSSSYTTIEEQYFFAALFSRVILLEKLRNA